MPPPPPISGYGKGKLLQTRARLTVNRTSVLTQYPRQKTTSLTTSTFDGPVVAPPLTLAMLKEGICLATRISQGFEAGSSGTSFRSNPVVPALLSMVKHLQYTGTVCTIPDDPSTSQGPPTAVVKPSVDTTKQVLDQVNN